MTSILNNRSNAIPIDHYGTVQDKLSALINSPAPDVGHDHHLFNIYTDLKLASWLQQKINPLTFIGWIEASIAEAHAQEVQRHPSITNKSEIINSRTTSYIRYYCQHTITDTLNMLAKYIQNAPAFENFRCSKKISLHNFEQELIEFSINNSTNGEKLEALPMDLFSEPVEVEMPGFEYGDKLGSSVKTWKFLQPKTTKHLRIWGDAVRNCVGSTTTYYTNMKKHKALIILACIDNKPRITIYAQLRDQKLEFDQVRDKMNTVLNDGQTYMLQQALMRALAVAAESRQALV